MYAIIRLGGKQYRVEENTSLLVDKLPGKPGEPVEVEEILAVGGGDAPVFGSPIVAGATVSATVIGDAKGPKIDGYTYKPKKNIRRHYGHRQDLTKVQINSIALGK